MVLGHSGNISFVFIPLNSSGKAIQETIIWKPFEPLNLIFQFLTPCSSNALITNFANNFDKSRYLLSISIKKSQPVLNSFNSSLLNSEFSFKGSIQISSEA